MEKFYNYMPILKSIINYLDSRKIKYEIINHRTVYTAQDKAATLRVDPKSVVKTVVVKLDKNYAIALIPANKNLDKMKLKEVVNKQRKKEGIKSIKLVDFAKEAWMKKNIPGKIGAASPLGGKFPIYIDATLLRQSKLIVNAGEYEQSINLTRQNFEKALNNFVKGNFSKAKK